MTWFNKIGAIVVIALGLGLLGGCQTVEPTPSRDTSATTSGMILENPWARATPGTVPNGAVFLKIVNQGSTDDQLVAAHGKVSATIELHTHVLEGSVMKMRAVPHIDVPKNQSVELRPGGLHIMLINLHAPLNEGTKFPLTLEFARSGRMTVEVPVKGPAEMAGENHSDHHHKH
ncbi:MAG: copper chaperone PCu(A)C [Magnetococcales bacterium]|nr:copper chaperone PCu(A)C [Magnetococcales bacterium]